MKVIDLFQPSQSFGTITHKDGAASSQALYMSWRNGTVYADQAFITHPCKPLQTARVGNWYGNDRDSMECAAGKLYVLSHVPNRLFLRHFEPELAIDPGYACSLVGHGWQMFAFIDCDLMYAAEMSYLDAQKN